MNNKDIEKQFEQTIKSTGLMLEQAIKKMPIENQIELNRLRQKVSELMSGGMKQASTGEFNAQEYSEKLLKLNKEFKQNGAKSNK